MFHVFHVVVLLTNSQPSCGVEADNSKKQRLLTHPLACLYFCPCCSFSPSSASCLRGSFLPAAIVFVSVSVQPCWAHCSTKGRALSHHCCHPCVIPPPLSLSLREGRAAAARHSWRFRCIPLPLILPLTHSPLSPH